MPKVLDSLDLTKNELQNAVVQNLASAPSSPVEGQLYYDTTAHKLYWRSNSAWVAADGSTAIQSTLVDAKGDLIVGTADNTVARKAVGANDTFLVAASGQSDGLQWRTIADGDIPAAIARDAEVAAAYQALSEKGAVNGYASLDGAGRVPTSQLPVSAMEYKGTWNATTNSPTLADGTGSTGDLYRVSVAGTQNLGSGNITFDVGDYAIYNGTTWEKGDTTDAVSSVFGRTGAVVSANGDYAASQVTNTPAGSVAATTVQGAIDEIATEYAAADAAHVAASDPHTQYARTFAVDCDAATSTVATHNLGTRDVTVQVRRTTTPWDYVIADAEATSTNTVTVRFATAPAAGDYRIIVQG